MKIRLDIVFKLFLSFWGASGIVSALAEVEPGNSCRDSSATNIDRCMIGESSQTLFTSVSNTTDVVVGGLLKDGEMLFIKGMRVEVEKMDFCVPSAAGGLTPLDKQLEGRQYFLRFTETNGVGFIWTEFDSFCGALRFADLACTLSSTMPAFMFRQKLRVNQSGVGDCQVELRDNGGVLLFVRGGIVVDVRNNDIELAKAIDELILTRTSERLKDCVGKSGLGRNGVKARPSVRELFSAHTNSVIRMKDVASPESGRDNGVVNGCELPQFIDALDKCETLWHSGKYEQLYSYVGNMGRMYTKSIPVTILLALREKHFSCQYELEALLLRQLTNEIYEVFCCIHPNFISRIAKMADNADEMSKILIEVGYDPAYRKENKNLLNGYKGKCAKYWWPRQFSDVPYLVPDIMHKQSNIEKVRSVCREQSTKILRRKDIGFNVFNNEISFRQKKNLLDDYVDAIVQSNDIRNLIDSLKDPAVQLNGYYALSLLREKGSEAKRLIKEYVEREDSSIDADEAKRMAVWALLQFAHDDPEIAIFLKQLPSKIDKSNWKTLAYLKDAINHLEQGCNRHFLKRGVK